MCPWLDNARGGGLADGGWCSVQSVRPPVPASYHMRNPYEGYAQPGYGGPSMGAEYGALPAYFAAHIAQERGFQHPRSGHNVDRTERSWPASSHSRSHRVSSCSAHHQMAGYASGFAHPALFDPTVQSAFRECQPMGCLSS